MKRSILTAMSIAAACLAMPVFASSPVDRAEMRPETMRLVDSTPARRAYVARPAVKFDMWANLSNRQAGIFVPDEVPGCLPFCARMPGGKTN